MNKKIEELTDLELGMVLEEHRENLDKIVQTIGVLKNEIAKRYKNVSDQKAKKGPVSKEKKD